MIDLGTGDGLFVVQSARANPNHFYIGIDANAGALEKISERVHRKPVLANVLFLQASVEELPVELNGIAHEVHVNFPWGSLLRAVVVGEVRAIRRICGDGAILRVVIATSP